MAQKIGVLAVTYGVRGYVMADAIANSLGYDATIHFYDKQENPFSKRLAVETGGEHVVGDLKDIDAIVGFAKTLPKGKVDFAIVGPEDPIIAGLADRLYDETGIVALCPRQEYAIEGSKIAQRELINEACPDANPLYKEFLSENYGGPDDPVLKTDFMNWYRAMGGMVAIKPDMPGYGAAVKVAGDHFDPNNEDEAFGFFMDNFRNGDVIVEEALSNEEFSYMCLSDGKEIYPTPFTRDFKRRSDGDRGDNTGGMATFKGVGDILPFMTQGDTALSHRYAEMIFNELKGGEARNPGLLGVPFYIAYAITDKGLKIFEINSRFGDPEGPLIIPLSMMPYAEVCMRMRDGDLIPFGYDQRAGILLYKVPPNYGGTGKEGLRDTRLSLEAAKSLADLINIRDNDETLLIYPGSTEFRDNGDTHALSSRTVASLGYSYSFMRAAAISQAGIDAITDDGLEYRKDPLDVNYWADVGRHADKLRMKSIANQGL